MRVLIPIIKGDSENIMDIEMLARMARQEVVEEVGDEASQQAWQKGVVVHTRQSRSTPTNPSSLAKPKTVPTRLVSLGRVVTLKRPATPSAAKLVVVPVDKEGPTPVEMRDKGKCKAGPFGVSTELQKMSQRESQRGREEQQAELANPFAVTTSFPSDYSILDTSAILPTFIHQITPLANLIKHSKKSNGRLTSDLYCFLLSIRPQLG